MIQTPQREEEEETRCRRRAPTIPINLAPGIQTHSPRKQEHRIHPLAPRIREREDAHLSPAPTISMPQETLHTTKSSTSVSLQKHNSSFSPPPPLKQDLTQLHSCQRIPHLVQKIRTINARPSRLESQIRNHRKVLKTQY